MSNIVQNTTQMQQLLDFIAANEELAYDIESTGLSQRQDSIIGFSIANSNIGYYIPYLQYNAASGNLEAAGLSYDQVRDVLQALSSKRLVGFNMAFDLPFTRNFFNVDLLPALWCDVMLLAHTCDENRRSYALKDIAADYFGAEVTQEQTDMFVSIKANGGTAKQYFKADLEPMAKYAIQDAVLTAKLKATLEPQLIADDLYNFFYIDEVMPLYSLVTIPMEQHGLRLDMPLLEQTLAEISIDISALEAKIQTTIAPHMGLFEQWFLRKDYPYVYSGAFAQQAIRYYGGDLPLTAAGAYSVAAKNVEDLPDSLLKRFLLRQEDLPEADIVAIQKALWLATNSTYMFNPNSRHHLKKLFFDTLGEESLNFTPTGQNQANEEFIESMVPKYAWAGDLITYYKLMKIKGTYVERFLDDAEEGRFYPKFFQHRTVSGRYSGDLQQLNRPIENPQPDDLVAKYNNRIRAFFIADEGTTFIDDDWESAEPRVFAAISNEQGIKDIFKNGEDFYSKIALLVEDLQGVSALKSAPNYLGKVNKTKRQHAKVYSLGIPYSMGGFKLQFELEIPLDQAEALVRKYLNAFPNLKSWMAATNEAVIKHGQVRHKMGRLRRMPRAVAIYSKYGRIILDDLELWKALNETPGLYNQAKADRRELKNYMANGANFQIQGLVASMLNRACIAATRAFKEHKLDATIVASIHDQAIVQASLAHKDVAAEILQQCMESICTLDVPMVAVPSFGTNLRDSKG